MTSRISMRGVSASVVAALLIGTVLEADASAAVVRRSTVSCRPSERVVVRRTYVRGRESVRVSCVSTTQPVVARRVVPHRSWKKTALVIGGSTAAGAGVGALVGGKKGALIGAAAGGAAGTAYEIHKRHKHRRPRGR
jgi:hypothetical protein